MLATLRDFKTTCSRLLFLKTLMNPKPRAEVKPKIVLKLIPKEPGNIFINAQLLEKIRKR